MTVIKYKDNLTDLVEELPTVPVTKPKPEDKNRRVVAIDGTVVTLDIHDFSNKKSIELSPRDIQEIVESIKNSIESALELITAKSAKNFKK